MITIDEEKGVVTVEEDGVSRTFPLGSPEGFAAISKAWVRSGWDTKYIYSFTWLGRPIIQLPEDMMRFQELIYSVKPDVIIEAGIAHGGSLVFYASLCRAMGHGRVIGVDVDIRAHNRRAIEEHELFPLIDMVEGDSIAPDTVARVAALVRPGERGLVVLDSNHTRAHVLGELRSYSPFVAVGSYLLVADGYMKDMVGAPRTNDDWGWNNPFGAVEDFLGENSEFEQIEPPFPFNEGEITERVTACPGGILRRVREPE